MRAEETGLMPSNAPFDAAHVSRVEFRDPTVALIVFDDGREVVCHGEMASALRDAVQVVVREAFVEARKRRWPIDENSPS